MSAAARQLKLGAVTYGVGGPGSPYLWLDEDIPLDASVDINWYIEQARLAEAAKFDLIFIVDSQFITADSPPHYLNRLEPLTLLSALAVSTTHLGLVATMTTSYNDPFNVARRLASLELISGGRSGWNVVTSGDAGAASNFSRDEHYDYDTRYARGLEFVQVCQGLWDSYEEDAFPRDRATRTFLDPSKQHAARLPPVRPGRPVPARGPRLRRAPRKTPFAGSPATVATRIPGVVRRPRPRRPQLQRRPSQPVAPLPRGGHPDPPGARRRPYGIRVDDAARQPGPPRPGKPLHEVRKSSSIPNVSRRLSRPRFSSRVRSLPPYFKNA